MLIVSILSSVSTKVYIDRGNYEDQYNYDDIQEEKDQGVVKKIDLSQFGEGVTKATISNSDISIEVPVWDGDYTYTYGSSTSSEKNGVTVDLSLSYSKLGDAYSLTLEDQVQEQVEMSKSVYEDMTEYISDVSLSNMITGDDWALQQINYSYKFSDKCYPCCDIIKAENCNGYTLLTTITVNNALGEEGTEEALEEACDMYEIEL